MGNTKDIYVIKNNINDKLYVGQSKNPEDRFRSHCNNRYDDNCIVDSAIAKYGKEHFWYEILEHDIENYNEREKYWIQELNTQVPFGYNIQLGGEEPPIMLGEDSPCCKISDATVLLIKNDLRDTSMTLDQIASKYGISKRQVGRINSGETRYDEKDKYPIRKEPNTCLKLTDDDVDQIIHELKYTYKLFGEIASEFNVGYRLINEINSGESCYCKDRLEEYPIRDWKSCGEKSPVTYEDVTKIIDLIKTTDLSMSEIARQYGVDKSLVFGISNGSYKKYRRLTEVYPLRPPSNNGKPKLTPDKVDSIIIDLKTTKKTLATIASEYETNTDTICRINFGEQGAYRRDNETYPIRPFEGFKFSKEDLDNIIYLLKNTTIPIKKIAKDYNVDDKTIALIRDGTTEVYRRSTETYPLRPPSKKKFLTDDEVIDIIHDIKTTSQQLKDIAKKYNIGLSTISGIVHGKSYKRPTETYPLR